MSTYAIGDIQGCFTSLTKLLKQINFDADNDTLWFAGDIVNRGPQSLDTLRFIKDLGDKHILVLGNHDLHLLALAYDAHPGWKDDTMGEILAAPDKDELIKWLIAKPLLHHDADLGYTMVHAGLSPKWDLPTARKLAREVETTMRGVRAGEFFHHMYGNEPDQWSYDLKGYERLRCITNFFTRVRFCYADGRVDLKFKGTLDNHPDDLMPWFQVPDRANADLKIIFGHWAALNGVTNTPNAFALDTGCVWGFSLTAMRLEDEKCFQVPCEI